MGLAQDGIGAGRSVLAPRRQVGVAVVVVSLHLLGVLAWWTARHVAPVNGKSTEPASIVVLLPLLVSNDAVHKKEPPLERFRRRADTHTKRSAGSISLSLPAADAALAAQAQSASAEPPTAASDLNLILSRKALSSLAAPGLAARTPFQGRLPATVESQIAAAAAETGPWTEERLDIDHIRYRRGTTCITMSRPKAAMIDPFSDSIRRLPWFAEMYSCK
jgi:hypothetical protein